ncbi:prion-inhibition and propagation domain-containing protein [Trichoderma barbatum]
MASPVGSALEAMTSLPATFVSIVECFEYVELGRRFGKDFNKSQARLEALKLQITRWGISSGALPDPQTGKPRELRFDAHAAETAQKLLESILEDTQELQKKSRKYSSQSGAPNAIDSMQPDEMDAPIQALKSKTSQIFAKRIQSVSLPKRVRWALYEKKHFDRLLEDITENLNLLMLTPQVSEYQHELCRMEVEEIQDGQPDVVMELLQDASKANNDALLEQAIQEAINNRGPGHSWERTEVEDNVRLEQGDRIANGFTGQAPVNRGNHKFGVTVGRGRAEIRQGDVYGSI